MRPVLSDSASLPDGGSAGKGPAGSLLGCRCFSVLIDLTSRSNWFAISIDMPQKSGTRCTQSVCAVKSHSEHLRAFFRPIGKIIPQWQHQLGDMLEIGSKRCGMRWLIFSSSESCCRSEHNPVSGVPPWMVVKHSQSLHWIWIYTW